MACLALLAVALRTSIVFQWKGLMGRHDNVTVAQARPCPVHSLARIARRIIAWRYAQLLHQAITCGKPRSNQPKI